MHHRPAAVLQPGSIDDVASMLRFCYDHRIPAATRGQGHATYGQAQVAGGLVIEMATLDAVRPAGDLVAVQAAARWSAVLAGLGQCAVLVRATLPLRPAPASVRHYILFYPSVAALTADQALLVRDGRFSFLEGEAPPNPDGSAGWQYYIEAAAYYDSTPPQRRASRFRIGIRGRAGCVERWGDD